MDCAEKADAKLASLVRKCAPSVRRRNKKFPLLTRGLETKIGNHLLGNLKESWSVYVDSSDHQLVESTASASVLEPMFEETRSSRQAVEQYLLELLRVVPSCEVPSASSESSNPRRVGSLFVFRLHRPVNWLPQATLMDLARLAWLPPDELLVHLNPWILDPPSHDHDHGAVRDAALLWMQLCVLEDRLRRCVSLPTVGSR